MYYKLYTNQKTIHTVIAIPVILILLFFAFFLTKGEKKETTQSNKPSLKSVEIVNLTDNSADVCWIMLKKSASWVIYGEDSNNLKNETFDSRDLNTGSHDRIVQCAKISDLSENTKYYFQIKQKDGDTSQIYVFTTTPKYSLAQKAKPLICKVFDAKGQPLEDGVVFVRLPGAYSLASFIKGAGECLVPLSRVVRKDGLGLLDIEQDAEVQIEAFDVNGKNASVSTKIKFLSSLPAIVIGKKYNVNSENAMESLVKESDTKENIIEDTNQDIQMYYPVDNARIPGDRPIFKGRIKNAEDVALTIDEARGGTTIIKLDSEGLWKYTPPRPLSEGLHKVTISSKNKENRDLVLTRSFSILKSGLNVLGIATPAATLTPTSSPSPEPTEEEPTVTPQKTLTVTPTTPVSGFNIFPFSVISVALIGIGIGVLLIF